MPDKTFEIQIKTTADPSGAREIKGELTDVKGLSESLNEKLAGTKYDKSADGGEAAARSAVLTTEQKITTEKGLQNAASGKAVEASVLEGANLENAHRAAENLTRTIASGGDVTRSLSSLFIALEPALGPAAIAAYGVYETLKATSVVAETLGKLFAGFSIGDLASGLNPEALIRELTAAHELERTLRDIDKQSFQQLSSGLEKAQDKLTQLTDLYRQVLIQDDGLLEPIFGKNEKIRQSIRDQITTLQEEVGIRQQATNVARGLATLEESRTIELERQKEIIKTQSEAQRQGTQLDKSFLDARESTLPAADKLQDFQTHIDTIKQHLLDMGVAAGSPNEAFQKSIGLLINGEAATEAQRNEVVKLAIEWLNLSGKVKGAQSEIDAFDKKRSQIRTALFSATDLQGIVKAANDLEELNKQAKNVIGIKAPGPEEGLEKFLLDTIANATSSTAEVNRFREALRLLYQQQGAAPKGPVFAPPNSNSQPSSNPNSKRWLSDDEMHGGDPFWHTPGVTWGPPPPFGSSSSSGESSSSSSGESSSSSSGELRLPPPPSTEQMQNQINQHAESVRSGLGKMADATAMGFKDMAQEIAQLHRHVLREIDASNKSISELWQTV